LTNEDRAALVRSAQPTDLNNLVLLCEEHAASEMMTYDTTGKVDALRALIFNDQPKLFVWVAVARSSNMLLGYTSATIDISTWAAGPFIHMDCLFVREGWRNAGIGHRLLAAVKGFAQSRRRATGNDTIREMQWQTPNWNVDAARFYERIGAVSTKKRRFFLRLT
jgi:GNAT superfamily N-acetyltransferase